MAFSPGQSGNPKGKAKGTTPTRAVPPPTAAALSDPDPLVFMARVMQSADCLLPYRLQAAGLLAPYKHSRMVRRVIHTPLGIDPSITVEQATDAIARISSLMASGQLALDEGRDLIAAQEAFINARTTTEIETRMRALEEAVTAALRSNALRPTLEIEAGLPVMPGCENVLMPPKTVAGPAPIAPSNGGRDGNGGSE
jgi:hypothetical protein